MALPTDKGKSGWSVEFLDETVEGEFDAFPLDIQANVLRISKLIRDFGLERVTKPYVAKIRGKIWEIRARGKDGWGRSLYCVQTGKCVVILRCFLKKTNKTPEREINIAMQRLSRM
jgi:phage-related protein